MNQSYLSTIATRWHLSLQVAPLLIPILGVKLFFHWMEWEFLSVNPLFTSLVAATTFLMGFLITGVIVDLKAHTIVEAPSFFLILGMIFLKLEPFYESVFFVTLVSLIVLYIIFLIEDLDNPFDYMSHDESATEVSFKPLHELELRLKKKISKKRNLIKQVHAYT